MSTKPDVLIIGGGIVGCATAFYLSRAGLTCAILERRPHLGGLTTEASMQAFRAQFTDIENIQMMRESVAVYENIADEIGLDVDIGLHQQGYLFATTREDGPLLYQARVELQHTLGLDDVDYLDGEVARRAFPFLAPEVTAATFREHDGWIDAIAAARAFARASGAAIHTGVDVTGLRFYSSRIVGVSTSAGNIAGANVVLAAGPFTKTLAAQAALELPLALIRRHRIDLHHNNRIPATAPMTIDSDTGAHWRPNGRGGANLALPEKEPSRDPSDPVPADDKFIPRAFSAVARLTPLFSQLGASIDRATLTLHAGLYTVTPDHKPLVGRTAYPGLWINAGYSGHGVMGAPSGARWLARLMTGQVDTNPFNPQRNALETAEPPESLTL